MISESLGRPCLLDLLVYNASARPFPFNPVVDQDPQEFVNHFNSSVMGCLHACQHVLPAMKEAKSGTVIITGATASMRGAKGGAHFAAGKMALRGLAQSMAKEVRRSTAPNAYA